MFCSKCGAQNPGNAKFCIKCGEKMATTDVASATVSNLNELVKDKRKLIMAAAAALAVILLFSLLFGGRGYKKTANEFMDSFVNCDAKGIVDLLPNKLIQQLLEEEGYGKNDKKLLIAELQDELDSTMGYMAMFGEYKLDYKIQGTQNVSKDQLSYIKGNYKEIGIKVSAAKTVEVTMTIDVLGMSQTENVSLTVIKIGGSWYIDIESMGNIL